MGDSIPRFKSNPSWIWSSNQIGTMTGPDFVSVNRGLMRNSGWSPTHLALEHLDERLAQPGRRGRNPDARRFHGGDLGFGVPLAARNHGARMAHGPSRRRGPPGDEPGHRLAAALFRFVDQELGGILFGRAADFPDHDDR